MKAWKPKREEDEEGGGGMEIKEERGGRNRNPSRDCLILRTTLCHLPVRAAIDKIFPESI